MSAIAGIYYRDGRPVAAGETAAMVERLAHRGPDGTGTWTGGSVGLGHCLLWTTPESLTERMPREHPAGHLILTADARIDNRDELMIQLGLTDRRREQVTDSEIILAAYEAWDEACLERLLGDFSLALWDARKQALFCARDHFGVKPFYYYLSDRVFAFGSEIKALLCLPEVPRRLNELKVSDYLTSTFDDTALTFYDGIFRLPPGHCVTVRACQKSLRRYWSLDPQKELRLGSDAEYAARFRDLFAEAVRCRLRSAFPVGSMLSGGLDSSSVACMAREIYGRDGARRLKTFSAVFDDVKECDERPYIEAVLAGGRMEPHYVHPDRLSPLTDLERVFWHEDEAFYSFNLFLTWAIYGAASAEGVRVLLDGFDGDTVVSHGFGYLRQLALNGRWLALAREIHAYTRCYPERERSPWDLYWRSLWRLKMEPFASRLPLRRPARRLWRGMLRRARPDLLKSPPRQIRWRECLNPTFIQELGIEERRRAMKRISPGTAQTEREEHYRLLNWGVMPFALEIQDRATGAFALEPRYPFWDRRLVEFCLSLPPEQKLHRGWSRVVMRRALEGILPPGVQWRPHKSNLGPMFDHALLNFEKQRLGEFLRKNADLIDRYVDLPRLQDAYERWSEAPNSSGDESLVIWRSVTLGLWLQHTGLTT